MPDSLVCPAPAHVCSNSCWMLSKTQKAAFLMGCRISLFVLALFGLFPQIFMHFLVVRDTDKFCYLELTGAAIIVNITESVLPLFC